MTYETVTVTVPTGQVGALLRFAASLADDAAVPGELNEDENESAPAERRWGWGRGAVQRAYLGGVSEVWRPFLDYLADRPAEWVAWPDLCEAIGRTPQEASGMLGAAERRCNGRPPFEKKWEGRVRHFRMPVHVAEVIKEIQDEE